MLITDKVVIWRDAEGDYHLEWDQSHPETRVDIQALADAEAGMDRDAAAYRARISGLPAGSRHFFRLCDEHGNEILASERRLGLHGTPNFRDFGGYRTADGREVKWGYLFRSGQLAHLNDADLALLEQLGLEMVCDFRQSMEKQTHPSRLPDARAPRILDLPIVPGNSSSLFAEAEQERAAPRDISPEEMFEFMRHINRDFVEGQREAFARMFSEILALDEGRFLIHCSAGKDRTGFAAALILSALGVPWQRVLEDYLLTARYFDPEVELRRIRRKYQLDHLPAEAIMPILEVHEAYLAAALASIESNYGSVENYLAEGLGVGPAEVAELRARYL
ncbi:tyrosine-protein phosphatase [Mangrovimicrobium sediminis]|uniref:Tyrosine-protein phosphatase n=1 Tax=Mangrovimicrobium sediminis TaxID=2562682 RepID=A0A4Z0M3S6_9GAMM|nr:tyrosine-protein phosphatase [Haliea sp. SAOS-164]TGD74272.1 tyrosine-protein phosphatase [Haliea sp. SAOS-164]